MSLNSPDVTVLMSVYNGERYLEDAIESILGQTFHDFEFIIINDGSTDGTKDTLTRYQRMDDRIRVYDQENRGLIAALNRGCQLARGKYIARMDADDISLPERLARQLYYMEAHPEVGVLGTWTESIDDSGRLLETQRLPTAPSLIRWALLFGNPIAHGSVMMRLDVIRRLGFYHTDALYSEDYDLWSRASVDTRIAIIPDVLLRYRVWRGSTSLIHKQTQRSGSIKVMHSSIERLLNSEVSLDVVATLRQMPEGPSSTRLQRIESAASLVQQLHHAYLRTNVLSPAEATEVARDAGRRLLNLAIRTRTISISKALLILLQALRLDWHLLPTLAAQIVAKAKRTLLGKD